MKVRGTDAILYEVTDMDRSISFYRDILGLKLEIHVPEMRYAEFDAPPTTLALLVPEEPLKTGGASIWLAVEDIAQAVEELRGKGVPITMDLTEYSICWHAAIADPDGNVVGLHQRKDGTFG